MELERRENENSQQYVWRIGQLKDAGLIQDSWDQLTPTLNAATDSDKCSDNWRKEYSIAKRYYMNVFQSSIETEDSIKASILKKQAQTKNLETNKWLREHARDELILEEIRGCVAEIANSNPLFIPEMIDSPTGKKVGVLCFGDEHFGTKFTVYGLNGEVINYYDDTVFYSRMNKLAEKTIQIIRANNLTDLYVFTFGDFADGILRTSQLLKLQYGIVESTIRYAEFLAEWLDMLSSEVRIHFQTTPGNHTELRLIGQPKGTFTNENMDLVVRAFIKERMRDNPNFDMKENPTGYIFEKIFGYNFLGVHGEITDANAVKNFATAYDTKINYFMAGHKHHKMADEIGADVEFIGVPSIIGVDPYAISLQVTSNPAATLLLIEDGAGMTSQHFIKL